MQKWLCMLCLVVSVVGCANPNVTILGPDAFKKHFSGPVATPVKTDTNTPAVATVKVVAPGMVLNVAVAQDASLNKYYTVPPSGMVDFSGAGRINVTGLTVEEVAKKIREPLERDFFQKADVSVTIETAPPVGAGAPAPESSGGGVIYVLGAVNRPGPLALPPNEVFTLAKTIISAGGFSAFGNGAKVRLIRYNETGHKYETYVNVTRILKNGEFEKDIPVQNGDWVIVSEKIISW